MQKDPREVKDKSGRIVKYFLSFIIFDFYPFRKTVRSRLAIIIDSENDGYSLSFTIECPEPVKLIK